MPFKFELGQEVIRNATGEHGRIEARTEFRDQREPVYQVVLVPPKGFEPHLGPWVIKEGHLSAVGTPIAASMEAPGKPYWDLVYRSEG